VTLALTCAVGMHSDGVISFRGKWYDPLVAHVTGVSLYQEWIPPETVREMSAALNRYSARRLARIWDKVWPMPWRIRIIANARSLTCSVSSLSALSAGWD
jgi:hypothetical protein